MCWLIIHVKNSDIMKLARGLALLNSLFKSGQNKLTSNNTILIAAGNGKFIRRATTLKLVKTILIGIGTSLLWMILVCSKRGVIYATEKKLMYKNSNPDPKARPLFKYRRQHINLSQSVKNFQQIVFFMTRVKGSCSIGM